MSARAKFICSKTTIWYPCIEVKTEEDTYKLHWPNAIQFILSAVHIKTQGIETALFPKPSSTDKAKKLNLYCSPKVMHRLWFHASWETKTEFMSSQKRVKVYSFFLLTSRHSFYPLSNIRIRIVREEGNEGSMQPPIEQSWLILEVSWMPSSHWNMNNSYNYSKRFFHNTTFRMFYFNPVTAYFAY